MQQEIKNSKVSVGLRAVLLALTVSVAAFGCTKKKDLVNKVDPVLHLKKSDIQDKMYHLVRGIEDVHSRAPVDLSPGYLTDLGLVKARVTEKELQFIAVHDLRNREATADTIASFPITKHFDIKRKENDYKEQLHEIVEDTEKPWRDRQYIRVDWSKPTNAVSGFTFFKSGITEENLQLVEDPKMEDGTITWKVESNLKASAKYRMVTPDSWELGTAYKVMYRTYLMPAKSSDFEPVQYDPKDFARFGYFLTQQNHTDQYKGLLDSNIERQANVFNVCEPGRLSKDGKPLSCSTNKIVWHINEEFPDKFLEMADKAVKEWNKVFKVALGRKDDVVVADFTKRVGVVDPRYHAIVTIPQDAGGCGIRQDVVDPRTGETITSKAIMYEACIRGLRNNVDELIDLMSDDPSFAAFLKNDATASSPVVAGGASVVRKPFLQRYESMKRQLGLDKPSRAQDEQAGTLNGLRSIVKSMPTTAPSVIMSNKRELIKRASTEFSLPEFDRLKAILGSSFSFAPPPLSPEAVDSGEEVADAFQGLDRDNSLTSLLMASGLREKEKEKIVREAESGYHGIEIVDEAVKNYLLGLIESNDPKDLKSKKLQILDEVEQRVYYQVLLHEMGHSFGLRHNFAGSIDKANFHPEYHKAQASGASSSKGREYEFSSVMDYLADFHVWAGGVSEYDTAAIRYAYNRSINRDNDEAIWVNPRTKEKREFKFCTDHQVGEDLMCNRWDRGTNVSEITVNRIEDYQRSYIFTHFRRDRARFDLTAGSRFSRAWLTMANIRQVLDETWYQIAYNRSESVELSQRTGSICDSKMFNDSIKAGEIIDICGDLVGGEALGVSASDWETFENGLKKDKKSFRKDYSEYIPMRIADMLYASARAKEFFADVLSAPEAGYYLVEPPKVKGSKLASLSFLSSDEDPIEALKVKAFNDGMSEQAQRDEYVKESSKRVIEIGPFHGARYYSSDYETVGSRERLTRIGFGIDKVAAISVLAERNLGVWKYYRRSMTHNPYVYPISTRFTSKMFQGLIGEDIGLKTIGFKLGADEFEAELPPTLSQDTKMSAILNGLTDLSIGLSSGAMRDRMAVCLVGEPTCTGKGMDMVEFRSSDGTKTYRAIQNLNRDSIAYDLVASARAEHDSRVTGVERSLTAREELPVMAKQLERADRVRARIYEALGNRAVVANTTLMSLKARMAGAAGGGRRDAETVAAWPVLMAYFNNDLTERPYTIREQAREIFKSFNGVRLEITKLVPSANAAAVQKCLDEGRTAKETLMKKMIAGGPVVELTASNPDGAEVDRSSPEFKAMLAVDGAPSAKGEEVFVACAATAAANLTPEIYKLLWDMDDLIESTVLPVLNAKIYIAFEPITVRRTSNSVASKESVIHTIYRIMRLTGQM